MQIGNIYKCKVVRVQPTFAILEYDNKQCICHISEISDYHVNNIEDYLKPQQEEYFMLVHIDTINHKYKFSYKRLRPHLLKYHYQIIESLSGFKNLYDNTIRELNKCTLSSIE